MHPSCTREWSVFKRSQFILNQLLTPPNTDVLDAIFIEFRPWYMVPQKKVYRALTLHECCICTKDVYPENVARQHVNTHPPICVRCYEKLVKCPFCRVRINNRFLMKPIVASASSWHFR